MDSEHPATQADDNDIWAEKIELIAKNQDKNAFAELFNHFSPRINSYIRSGYESSISPQLCDEITQEVMIKVWKKAGSYSNSKAKVSTWIFTIARNTRIDTLRSQKNQNSTVSIDDIWYEQESEETPFTNLQVHRSSEVLKEKFESLKQDQRQILFKAYMEGKSHSQISEELDLPLGTVKSKVRLALQKLATLIDR